VHPTLLKIFTGEGDLKHNRQTGPLYEIVSGPLSPRRKIAIAAVLTAMVLVVLDAAIANIALPTIAHSLQVTPARSIWVITAYQTALLMALLPCAALGESLGYRRVFTAGVALFTAASSWCALSPSLSWLVAGRFVQGLGGAAVMALGIALLRMVVSDGQLGIAIGWNAQAVALASAAGPALGAAVLRYFVPLTLHSFDPTAPDSTPSATSWPWLFAINLPLGLLVLLATRALPDATGTARRVDLFSVALHAGACALLVIGAELLPTRPALAAVLLAATALVLVALIRREMPKGVREAGSGSSSTGKPEAEPEPQVPLIPFDLFRAHSFGAAVIASVCCFAGQTAGMVSLPFYLKHQLGQDTLMAALYLTPWPLTVAITAPFAGRLADRVSTARLCGLGGVCLATGLGAIALWPFKGNLLPLVPFTMLCGLGFALFNVANNRQMFLSTPKERSGAAGGMQGTARLTGQTTGAVIMTLLFTITSTEVAPQVGLAIGAFLTLAAGLVVELGVTGTVHESR
jgi:MFS transporter, DHA2 family, multidrug resistance protein